MDIFATLKQLQDACKVVDAKAAALEGAVNKLQSQITSVDDEVAHLQREAASACAVELDGLSIFRGQLAEDVNACLALSARNLEALCMHEAESFTHSASHLQDMIADVEKKVESHAAAAQSAYQDALGSCTSLLSTGETALANIRDSHSQLEGSLRRIEAKETAQKASLEAARSQVAAGASELTELKANARRVVEDLRADNALLEASKAGVATASAELATAREGHDIVSKRRDATRNRRDALRRRLGVLTSQRS